MNTDPLAWMESGALLQGALFRSLVQKASDEDMLPVGTRLGPWRVIAPIGVGGMAAVYRAERADGQFAQTVAIKCVPANPSLRDLELFRRERQFLAELNHPNIARLLDGGSLANGRAWLAMELIEGQRIDAHAEALKLDLRQRIALFQQVLAAVGHAHQRLLIHRDIKPGNVLVDAEGRVKLLDFGIAGLVDDALSPRAYSPGWASPEQTADAAIGPASDQYQLGLLLGKLIDDCERCDAVGRAHLAELRAICARSCMNDPGQRYHSVAELSADLERWSRFLPVQAVSGGWLYPLRCALRRRPWLSAGIALAALTLLVLVIGFNWRLKQAQLRAQRAADSAQAINRFLTEDLLAQADPYVAPQADLRMRDVLDRARAGIGAQFRDEPATEIGVRATLAVSYSGLGEYEIADQELANALRLAEQSGVLDADDLLDLRVEIVNVRARLGHDQQALDQLKALAEERRQRLGADDRKQIGLLLRGVQMLVAMNRFETALSELAALTPRMHSVLAEDDILQVDARIAEGEAATRLAQFERAERALLSAQTLLTRIRGDDAPRLSEVILNRAVLARQRGDYASAIALQNEVVQRVERRFGRHHPETLRALNELASMLQDDRQFAAAEALFREVLNERERRLGVGDVLTRNSLNNLGLVLSLQDKLDEAEQHYRRALSVERELKGADDLDVLILAHNLAGLLRRRGDFEAALAMHQDTLMRAERSLGNQRYEPALFGVGLAQTLQRMRRLDAAEQAFLSARARLVSVLGSDHPRVVKVDEMLKALRDERRSESR